MDTQHLNALLDLMEEYVNDDICINDLFDLQDSIRQADNRKFFEMELRDTLISHLSRETLQLM